MIKIASVFALSLILLHCTKKSNDNKVEIKNGDGTTRETSVEELKKSIDIADQELGKMVDEVSNMGFQDADKMGKLIADFKKSNDKFEKFKLCSPISLASISYGIRAKIKKEIPQLTRDQLKTIEEAKKHCKWAGQTIVDYESKLSDDDLTKIAKAVPNSLVPYKRTIFAMGQKCNPAEYSQLLSVDAKNYKDTKILSALLILTAIQEEGNLKTYIPAYKEVLKKSNHPEKKFITQFVESSEKQLATPRNIQEKQRSVQKAAKAFAEAGIKDVPKFVIQSMKIAPKCLSSVNSGVIDISKIIVTSDRLKALHQRISKEVKKTGKLPPVKPITGSSVLKEMDGKFSDKLLLEKVAIRDKWFHPIMLTGTKGDFKVISAGKDRKPGTSDDMVYPSR